MRVRSAGRKRDFESFSSQSATCFPFFNSRLGITAQLVKLFAPAAVSAPRVSAARESLQPHRVDRRKNDLLEEQVRSAAKKHDRKSQRPDDESREDGGSDGRRVDWRSGNVNLLEHLQIIVK